jgi:hypothetical protein
VNKGNNILIRGVALSLLLWSFNAAPIFSADKKLEAA